MDFSWLRNFRPTSAPALPRLLEIEPTLGCNLRCVMCHVSTMKEKTQFLDIDALANATEDVTDIHVMIGSEFEPTIHPNFDKLLRLAADRRWKVDFLTNAANLHRYDDAILSSVRFHVFNVSFDGITKANFERIRRGADYDVVLANALRGAAIARRNGAYTAVNAVVLRSNLGELRDLIQFWDDQGFDLVRLFAVQLRAADEDLFAESLYPVADEFVRALDEAARMVADRKLRIGVRSGYFGTSDFRPPDGIAVHEATISSTNPTHRHVPGVRQDFLSGRWPGMDWPCSAAHVYARIRWDGNVDLCNKREIVIGNIRDKTFRQIWSDHAAREHRRSIRDDVSLCSNCDFFRLCINSRTMAPRAKESHFPSGALSHPKIVAWLDQIGEQ